MWVKRRLKAKQAAHSSRVSSFLLSPHWPLQGFFGDQMAEDQEIKHRSRVRMGGGGSETAAMSHTRVT